jgi:hypothetical protein
MNDAARQKYVFRLLQGSSWAFLLCVLLFVGCSSEPAHYEGAFSASQQVKGSSESISAPMDRAWGSVLEVLSQQGFLIQQADAKSHILANREMRSKDDKDLSHTVAATVTLFSSSDQMTRVMVAANQTTELHKKSYTWWHLLWLIPVFPTGTEYTTVVVERDTVRSPQFYRDFFGAVNKSAEEKKNSAQSAPAS